MRFGIMAMQLDALIPSGSQDISPEQAMVNLLWLDHAGLARDLVEKGFDPIELNGDLAMLLPHTFAPTAIEGLSALKEELGVRYTVHLPLWSIEPSTLATPVRQGSVEALIQSIQITRPLEPEMYVLHATGALAAEFYRMRIPEIARAVLMRQFQNAARESIRTILTQTGLPSRMLAIETIEFPFDLTLELAEEMDLSICFDTGHVLVGFSGPVDFFEALERCLPRLGEIHLHDGPWYGPQMRIGYGKDHQPLGRGDLDTGRLLDRLTQAGYQGPIVFELQAAEALASLDAIRALRPGYVAP